MWSVKATVHQGNMRFYGAGQQCVTNSFAAIAYSQSKPPIHWTKEDLDTILQNGDRLYRQIGCSGHLLIEDLPTYYENFQMNTITTYAGSVYRSQNVQQPYLNLNDAVQMIQNNCFLTFKSSTIAIIKCNEQFFIFDPHSRNRNGLVAENGTAVLTCHSSRQEMMMFLEALCDSLGGRENLIVPYEMTVVRMILVNYSDSESEFSGFSEISDGEFEQMNNNLSAKSSIGTINKSKTFDDRVEGSQEGESADIDQSEGIVLDRVDRDQSEGIVLDRVDTNQSEGIVLDSGDRDQSEGIVLDREDRDQSEGIVLDSGDRDQSEGIVLDRVDRDQSEGIVLEIVDIDQSEGIVLDRVDRDQSEGIVLDRVDRDQSEGIVLDRVDRDQSEGIVLDSGDRDQSEGIVLDRVDRDQSEGIVLDSGDRDQSEGIVLDRVDRDQQYEMYRGRKRVRNESDWARNIAKRLKNSGKQFFRSGRLVPARQMKKGCGTNCRYKCHLKFSQSQRESIFHGFWGLGDITSQRQFLLKYAGQRDKESKKVGIESRREKTFQWCLPSDEIVVRVCKTFFLDTLSISDQMVNTAVKKSIFVGVCEPEKRGKHDSRHNKTPTDKIEFIIKHIKSFPTIESHYCRKDSKKMYLPSDLSVPKMYRLYVEECERKNLQPLKISLYRSVFDHRFNLSFHRPTKDQCEICTRYKNLPVNEKEAEVNIYENHRTNVDLARKSKDADKIMAKEDNELVVACFDLQEVLLTPKGFASAFHYKRRLNTFNFSIYNLGNSKAHCFIWNETISGRGASDIASCVYRFVKCMAQEGKRKFIFYSDNCWPQNKNRFYASMIWYAVQKLKLKFIEHKYLEKGHTQNENDSVHAAIERASRYISVYTTQQWATVARTACARNPYTVTEMHTSEFFNFKELSNHLKNFDIDEEKNKVYWSKFRTFKIANEMPHIITFQYEFDGEKSFLNLAQRRHNRSQEIPHPNELNLSQLNKERPSIGWDKYCDLLHLCHSGLIPRVHHDFFLWLPYKAKHQS